MLERQRDAQKTLFHSSAFVFFLASRGDEGMVPLWYSFVDCLKEPAEFVEAEEGLMQY